MSKVKLSTPTGTETPTGKLSSLQEIGAAMRGDERTRAAAADAATHARVVGETAKAVTVEIARDPQVQEAARRLGRTALEDAGILRPGEVGDKVQLKYTGIAQAVADPQRTARKAIESTRGGAPNLGEAVVDALPGAIGRYNEENPGSLRSTAKAVGKTLTASARTAGHATATAVRTGREIRADNKRIRAQHEAALGLGLQVQEAQRAGQSVSVHQTVRGDAVVIPNGASVAEATVTPISGTIRAQIPSAPGAIGTQPIAA